MQLSEIHGAWRVVHIKLMWITSSRGSSDQRQAKNSTKI